MIISGIGKLYNDIHHKDSIFKINYGLWKNLAFLGVNQKNVNKFKNHKKKNIEI